MQVHHYAEGSDASSEEEEEEARVTDSLLEQRALTGWAWALQQRREVAHKVTMLRLRWCTTPVTVLLRRWGILTAERRRREMRGGVVKARRRAAMLRSATVDWSAGLERRRRAEAVADAGCSRARHRLGWEAVDRAFEKLLAHQVASQHPTGVTRS